MASNQVEIEQLVKNYIASLLRVLENENENTNILEFMDPIVEVHARVISDSFYMPNSENSHNARIQELAEELRIYYDRILNHESLRYVFQEAHEHALLLIQPSRQSDPRFMAEVKEKLKEFLRKFLEVETALNDQQ